MRRENKNTYQHLAQFKLSSTGLFLYKSPWQEGFNGWNLSAEVTAHCAKSHVRCLHPDVSDALCPRGAFRTPRWTDDPGPGTMKYRNSGITVIQSPTSGAHLRIQLKNT